MHSTGIIAKRSEVYYYVCARSTALFLIVPNTGTTAVCLMSGFQFQKKKLCYRLCEKLWTE